MDQIETFPVGAKVELACYGAATVIEHCADGRAIFDCGNESHTFHDTNGWIISVSAAYNVDDVEKFLKA